MSTEIEFTDSELSSLKAAREKITRIVIELSLQRNDNNRAAAARELGITVQTLHGYLRNFPELQIDYPTERGWSNQKR